MPLFVRLMGHLGTCGNVDVELHFLLIMLGEKNRTGIRGKLDLKI